jgi:hypothetical protein
MARRVMVKDMSLSPFQADAISLSCRCASSRALPVSSPTARADARTPVAAAQRIGSIYILFHRPIDCGPTLHTNAHCSRKWVGRAARKSGRGPPQEQKNMAAA